jgi:hypothetical protein
VDQVVVPLLLLLHLLLHLLWLLLLRLWPQGKACVGL